MPNPSLSEAIKEAYASCPTGKVIFETLEIRQTGVQSSIFLVKGQTALTAFDEDGNERVFFPSGFNISLPPENEEGFRSLNIAIDNIGRAVSDFVELARSEKVPVEVIYRPYVSGILTAPAMIPPLVLYLKDIQVNTFQVTGRATFFDIVNRKFPSELYTRARFPALG